MVMDYNIQGVEVYKPCKAYVKNRNYSETELSYEFSNVIEKNFNSGLETEYFLLLVRQKGI